MSKISELSNGGALLSTDDLIVVRSGGNVRAQLSSLNGIAIGGSTPAAGSFTTGSFTGNVSFADNAKAIFGAGSDLQIYHDASHSYIVDAGTGNMYLSTNGNGIVMQASLSETMFAALPNGAVTLYHNNAAKLATTSTGIDVTGSVTADGLTSSTSIQTTGSSSYFISNSSSSGDYIRLYAGSGTGKWDIYGNGANLRIGDNDSAGSVVIDTNVGIGATSLSARLHVKSSGTGNVFYVESSDGGHLGGFYQESDTRAAFNIRDASGNVKVNLDSGGDSYFTGGSVGIGVSSIATNTKLHVKAGTNINFEVEDSSGDLRLSALNDARSANVPMQFAASRFQFVTGGVGIGISNPDSFQAGARELVVGGAGSHGITVSSGTSNTGNLMFADGTSGNTMYRGYVQYQHNGDKLVLGAASDDRVIIDGSGNLSLGVAGASRGPLHVHQSDSSIASNIHLTSASTGSNSGDGFTLSVSPDGSGDTSVALIQRQNSAMKFYTHATERMRLDNSGNLLVGTSSSSGSGATSGKQIIQFNGATANGLYVDDTRTSSGSDNAIIFGRGTTYVGAIQTTTAPATNYVSASDVRLKENIADAEDAGEQIDAIQVRQFDWKGDGSHQDYGLIAQELQSIAPNAVSTAVEPDEMLGIDPSKLVPMLIKEIQTLRRRVQQLENN